MKVVVLQPIAREGIETLEKAGLEVVLLSSLDPALVSRELVDAEGLLVRNAPVTREMLEGAPKLRVIGRHGVGVDTIDVQAATSLGIRVVNTPTANSLSVAEHVILMILALAKNLPAMDRGIRAGDFDIRHRIYGTEIQGKTLSILGLGRVGRLVARKATLGLGMRVLAYDPYLGSAASEPEIEVSTDWDRMFSEADFLTLNLPLTPETRGCVGTQELGLMKKSAYLVNCARAEVVDSRALVSALEAGTIRGAGIDVYVSDPPPAEDPILSAPNTLLTPHSAAHTDAAMVNMAVHAARGIVEVLSGNEPTWPVNRPDRPR